LCLSIDGATAETYERVRVRSRFGRVVGNIEGLVAAKQRLGRVTPRLRLVMVVMRQNLHELPRLVRLAADLSFEEVFVQHLCHDFGESTLPPQYLPMQDFVQRETLLEEDIERVEAYFDAARDEAARLGIELRLPRPRPKEHAPGTSGRDRCSWPWTSAYVSYQGLAMPCCMVATPDRINFGSMANQGVRAIWESATFQRFRDRLEAGEPDEVCRSCSVYAGTF
jgi:radical SAM protein with 4Fe4S-binding SPASM domain